MLRKLENFELSQVAGGAVDQVIMVTAKIQRDGGGGGFITYSYQPYSSNSGVEIGAPAGSGDQAGDNEFTAGVTVQVSDSDNQDEATAAAENIARALAELKGLLENMDPNTPISWDGRSMSAADVLNYINNTAFIITDDANYNNGGVGAANAETNTDTLYYGSFDGIGDNDYAGINYVDDAGLKAILLHEIGHLSDEGNAYLQNSLDAYEREYGTRDGYYDDGSRFHDQYSQNNEKFANDFAYAVGNIIGANIGGVSLPYGTGAMDPEIIYDTHMGY